VFTKHGREIAKLLKILCSLEFPYIIHDKNGTLRTKLSLKIINDYILLQNNSNNTNLMCVTIIKAFLFIHLKHAIKTAFMLASIKKCITFFFFITYRTINNTF
jgi:hypothetical protein